MAARRSRAQLAGEHTYLLNGIPLAVWNTAVLKTAQDHERVCGDGLYWKCPVHSMRAVLLRLLGHYAGNTPYVDERL